MPNKVYSVVSYGILELLQLGAKMKKIQLTQASWLRVDNAEYGPGAIIDIEDSIADSMISSGSAISVLKEVKGNADKAGSNSSKT